MRWDAILDFAYFGGITDHKLPGTKSEIRELDITLKDLSSIQKPRNENDWNSKNMIYNSSYLY